MSFDSNFLFWGAVRLSIAPIDSSRKGAPFYVFSQLFEIFDVLVSHFSKNPLPQKEPKSADFGVKNADIFIMRRTFQKIFSNM
jgi:hypothetical protein